MTRFEALLRRVIAGAVGLSVFLFAVIPDNQAVTIGFFSLLSAIAGLESARALGGLPLPRALPPAVAAGLATAGLALGWKGTPSLIVLAIMVQGFSYISHSGPRGSGRGAAGAAGLTILYALGLGLLSAHRTLSDDAWILMIPMLICWIGDSAAYFVGTAIGRHKLAPRLSPNKSWEGLIAGLVGSGIGAFVAGHLFAGLGALNMICLGIVGGAFAVLGDLTESSVKRDLGLKDTGGILPGHGGVLDRFDSAVAVAPLTWIWLSAAGALGDLGWPW